MFGQGFGGLPVDAMFGELLQFVEGAAVEVEEGAAGSWVGEEACEACRSAGFEVLGLSRDGR